MNNSQDRTRLLRRIQNGLLLSLVAISMLGVFIDGDYREYVFKLLDVTGIGAILVVITAAVLLLAGGLALAAMIELLDRSE